jgi:hypothetical protein
MRQVTIVFGIRQESIIDVSLILQVFGLVAMKDLLQIYCNASIFHEDDSF